MIDVGGARSPTGGAQDQRPHHDSSFHSASYFDFGKLSFVLQLEWGFALLKEERRLVEKFVVENGKRVRRFPSEANNILKYNR